MSTAARVAADARIVKVEHFDRSNSRSEATTFYAADNGHGSYTEQFMVTTDSSSYRVYVWRNTGWTQVVYVKNDDVTDTEHAVSVAYMILHATP